MGRSKKEIINSEIDAFLKKVTLDNFYKSYDEFKDLIVNHKNNFTKSEILQLLFDYNQNNSLEEYQEDVLTEIENRIFGYCSPSNNIIWDKEE
jgi:hypothetical protein